MKDADFRKLLKSIDEAKEIHLGKRKASRIFCLQPIEKLKGWMWHVRI